MVRYFETLGGLSAKYARLASRLPSATALRNDTGTGVFDLLDAVTAHVTEALGPLACRIGCSQCCDRAPLASAIEWEGVPKFLGQLPAEVQATIHAAARALEPQLADLQAVRERFESDNFETRLVRFPCPFLIDGACSIYEVRPLVCRGFGHAMVAKGDGSSEFFGSDLALAHFDANVPGRPVLPMINPYFQRIRELNIEAHVGVVRFLPEWLLAMEPTSPANGDPPAPPVPG